MNTEYREYPGEYLKCLVKLEPERILITEVARNESTGLQEKSPADDHEQAVEMHEKKPGWATATSGRSIGWNTGQNPHVVQKATVQKHKQDAGYRNNNAVLQHAYKAFRRLLFVSQFKGRLEH